VSRITDLSRLKQGRGSGEGAFYKPWILTRELGSLGTTANPIDYKTGRIIELLSRNEYYYWEIMRFKDDVLDIREQFPLQPLSLTMRIAEELGFNHPQFKGKPIIMTTDSLLTTADGYLARNIKLKKDLQEYRVQEKFQIEAIYWKLKKIPFKVITEDSIDKQLALNLAFINEYHDIKSVHDDFSIVKHLLSNKLLETDLSRPINLKQLMWDNQTLLQKYKQKEVSLIGCA